MGGFPTYVLAPYACLVPMEAKDGIGSSKPLNIVVSPYMSARDLNGVIWKSKNILSTVEPSLLKLNVPKLNLKNKLKCHLFHFF